MKSFALLLTAGLASASVSLPRQVGASNLNIGGSGASSIGVNGFNLGGLNLDRLEVGGLNLGSVDLRNQDVIAEAILAMLGGFCLGNALNRNQILSLGFNNDRDLFFQLAQLMQLEQLGFVDLGGIQSLFGSGQAVGGGFNLGLFKREVSEAKTTMKRTKLRRGETAKRQCAVGGVGVGSGSSGEEDIFNIATAPPDPLVTGTATATADEAGFTIATAPSEEEGFTIATAPTAAAAAAQTVSLIDAAASAAAIAAANAASAGGESSVATAAAEVAATATAAAAAATSTAAAEV